MRIGGQTCSTYTREVNRRDVLVYVLCRLVSLESWKIASIFLVFSKTALKSHKITSHDILFHGALGGRFFPTKATD